MPEIRDPARYSKIGRHLTGAPKVYRGEKAEIDPAEIDLSPYDLFYIGRPVRAFHPTPAINAAIAALKNCEGRNCVVFATSGGMPGETLALMASALRERGAEVIGSAAIRDGEITSERKIRELAGFAAPVSTASSGAGRRARSRSRRG
ncbi:MAG: ArsR family transcriptional regulator [Methanomicrobiaceae archaeon]|nr:ArsR family transcriptional regulator [Methanomicrobiaceae archaeon]